MLRISKKILSGLLAAVIVLMSIPLNESSISEFFTASASSVSDFIFSENEDGTLNLVQYTGKEKNVVLPDSVDGKRVTTIATDAFKDNSYLQTIRLKSISYIAPLAFNNCPNFHTISYVVDENYDGCFTDSSAFNKCDLLTFAQYSGEAYYFDWLCKKLEITEETSDYDKVSKVFNYFKSSHRYNFSVLNGSSRYDLYFSFTGAIMGAAIVCSGFAESLFLILNHLGVDCIAPSGLCTGTAHQWNMVNLDGYWYHLDASGPGYLPWYPFLVSDSEIKRFNASFDDATPAAEYNYSYAPELLKSGDFYYSINSDNSATIEYCRFRSEITEIPDTINGHTVKAIGDYAFYGFQGNALTIPDTIESIGKRAFALSEISKLIIPDSVTYIGNKAFLWSHVTVVYLPSDIESIPADLFCNIFGSIKVFVPENTKTICTDAFTIGSRLTLIISGKNTIIEDNAFIKMYDHIPPDVKIYHVPDAACTQYTQEDATLEFSEFENNLTAFSIGKNVCTINNNNATVSLVLEYNSSLNGSEEITFTASDFATVSIPENIDFSESFNVTVTSYDGREKVYTVSISIAEEMEPITGDGFEIKGNYCLYPQADALAENYTHYMPPSGKPGIGDVGGGKWTQHRNSIYSVIFPENAYRIGEYALAGLNNVSEINIPSSVESIGAGAVQYTAFYNNTDNWTDNVLYSGEYALEFPTSTSVDEITIREGTKVIADNNFDCFFAGFDWKNSPLTINIPDSVINIGTDFAFDYFRLENILVDDNNSVYSDRDGLLYDKAGETLIKYPENKDTLVKIPDGTVSLGPKSLNRYNHSFMYFPDSIKEISENVFSYDSAASSWCVIFFEGSEEEWNNISGISQFESAKVLFNQTTDFSEINNVIATSYYTKSFVTEDKKFYCGGNGIYYSVDSELEDYPIEELYIMDGITSIHSSTPFYGLLGSLKKLYLPSSLTSLPWGSFTGLKSLEYVSVENADIDLEPFSFLGCEKDIELHFGAAVDEIEWTLITSLEKVAKISVDKNNPVYSARDGILYNKDMTLLHYYPVNKADSSFVIPDSVTEIEFEAFVSDSIKEITIPLSVKKIGSDAFRFADSLEKIYYEGSADDWAAVVMDNEDRNAVKNIIVFAIEEETTTEETTTEEVTTEEVTTEEVTTEEVTTEEVTTEEVTTEEVTTEEVTTEEVTTEEVTTEEVTTEEVTTEEETTEEETTEEETTEEETTEEETTEEETTEEETTEEETTEEPEKLIDIIKNSGAVIKASPSQGYIYIPDSIKTTEFIQDSNILVVDKDMNKLDKEDYIKSGSKIYLLDNNSDVIEEISIVLPGDIDADGTVSAADARLALRFAVKLEHLEEWQIIAADTDLPSKATHISASDARYILRCAVKLENLSVWFKETSY